MPVSCYNQNMKRLLLPFIIILLINLTFPSIAFAWDPWDSSDPWGSSSSDPWGSSSSDPWGSSSSNPFSSYGSYSSPYSSYSPYSYSPPSYSPPSYSPYSYSPPSYSPYSYSPPSYSPYSYSPPSYNYSDSDVDVKGYYRQNGTYVQPYSRTRPDSNPYNNYGFPGNYNPNTGEYSTGSVESYLRNYYNK